MLRPAWSRRSWSMSLVVIPLVASSPVHSQSAPAPAPAPPPAEQVMPTIEASAELEDAGRDSLRTTTTAIGKGVQALRDVPQSVTVVTEKLLDDRNLTTLKESLRQAGGVSFQAAEGAEEDIRLRGFSLQSTGDIFIDGMRDPAFYDRDSFNWDRLEVLRGSASMLFGRGSTGGAANQVTKQASLRELREVALTAGSGDNLRILADVNVLVSDSAALRLNGLFNRADGWGNGIDKFGLAPSFRWGIGSNDEFTLSAYLLEHDNGIHYGLPWLTPGANGGGDYLWDTPPENYYGMASDNLGGGTTQGNAVHVHAFGEGRQLRTALRVARYGRDQRASAVRFANATLQPGRLAVTADTFSDATVLTRGTQNKIMDLDTQYLQSDYSGSHQWWGRTHAILGGLDAGNETFENFAASLPAGVTLTKVTTTVGTPDDGAGVDESQRLRTVNRDFRARSAGVYVQDLLQVTDTVKLLAGLRWDRFEGDYRNRVATGGGGANPCTVAPLAELSRSDSLFSRRFGVLYQPSSRSSFHLSYGTSFNTSGDTYQYDPGTADTPPESSRNLELGARIDSWSGDFTTRFAVFHSTKYNERNRDADTVNACNYVLSGERHVAGFEADFAGRIAERWELYASYAFLPIAEVDAASGAAGTEPVGSRPGLTPRHSGTVWSTYAFLPNWRVGGGLNARSKDKPVGLAADSPIEAPAWVTGDLMLEYATERLALRANVLNLTDEHYAETLYRGHYVPGKPRMLELTATLRF